MIQKSNHGGLHLWQQDHLALGFISLVLSDYRQGMKVIEQEMKPRQSNSQV
jgi:hypothetical protein